MSWLDAYFAPTVQALGTAQPPGRAINFGAGFAVADNGSALTVTPTIGGAAFDQTVPFGGLGASTRIVYDAGTSTWILSNPVS